MTYQRLPLLLALAMVIAACSSPRPASAPTSVPTETAAPSSVPTAAPTSVPTAAPTAAPTEMPTEAPTEVPTEVPTEAPTSVPTQVPVSLDGTLSLARGSLTERPFAVMLDNHPGAYPQIGLNDTVLVFEALAEFGITRYMAIFAPGISPESAAIGPVRSARPYFVEWAKGLRALYAHAGGSPEGLLLAQTSIEILNADALRRDSGAAFRRSAERAAPHNLFTDTASLGALRERRDSAAPADLDTIGFDFKADAPPDARPAAQDISYFFIYRESYVAWSYDPANNSYRYFRQRRPHIDARSGEQITTQNIVVLEVPERPIPGDPKGRIEQLVTGEGRARLFRDGAMVEATWRKAAGFAQLEIVDANGVALAMNPGRVWIAAIPSLDNLTVEGGL